MSRHRIALLAVALLAVLQSRPPAAVAISAARDEGGAVVSAEPASTRVGLEILRRGGNAADAAVATALAMAVVHPQAGNLGGGGFAVVSFSGLVDSLDFRETAPRAASRDMYVGPDGEPRPEASLVGPLASGVPGTPAGLEALHRRFGLLPWRVVVEPARKLADDGFVVSARLAKSLDLERDLLGRFPETAKVWLPGGEPPKAGTKMRLPQLARTLEVYAEEGASGLQTGEIARRVAAAVERHSGILDATDLASYRPHWRPPLEFESFGWRFAAMDLPSSGGYLLAASLEVMERLGVVAHPASGADRAHLLAETWRRVFADRAQLGDPSSTHVEVATLLAPERLHRLASGIDSEQATRSTSVRGWPEAVPRSPLSEPSETVHLAVIDRDGNVVSLTTTLNGAFGCGLWVSGAGFFLNNEMDDFTVAPGHPNMFGLIQGPANEIAAGRRMLSSMVPTIGWRGRETIAIGARGGSRIPTAVTQALLALLVDGDDLSKAVGRPRIHHQWLPDHILAETDALSEEARRLLERRGHRVEVSGRNAKVNAVRRLGDGTFEAAGDPRGPASGGVLGD